MSQAENAFLREVERVCRRAERRVVWRSRLHRVLGWSLCALGGLVMHRSGAAGAFLRLVAPSAVFG